SSLGQANCGPVPTVRALRKTLELVRAGKLDAIVFKALLAVVPAFAPGSLVTLSDGRRCVVTGWDGARPCSPTVCPLPVCPDGTIACPVALDTGGPTDASGAKLLPALGEAIDLRDRDDLRVVRIDGHDVSRDLFSPANLA